MGPQQETHQTARQPTERTEPPHTPTPRHCLGACATGWLHNRTVAVGGPKREAFVYTHFWGSLPP